MLANGIRPTVFYCNPNIYLLLPSQVPFFHRYSNGP